MRLLRDKDGNLQVKDLAPLHADTLLRIPEWLRSDDPRVRDRLLPPAYEDDDLQDEWCQLVGGELEHLFKSRCELVEQDLQEMTVDDDLVFSLPIPREHCAAWLSALNAARLALFAMHDLEAEDMEVDLADIEDGDKELVVLRIHIMAFLQEMMIEAGV